MAPEGRDRTGEVEPDFRLGDWLVQPSQCRISRAGRTVHLRPKVMDVLVCLAARPGVVVAKETVIDLVWAKRFISDAALSRAVYELRRALGDEDAPPRYVETIAKRGYRLVAPVDLIAATAPIGASAALADEPSRFVLVIGEREVRLGEGENVIGRGAEARVRLDSSAVSRSHASVVVDGERAVLQDLGSKNGTEVDGRRVAAPLELADRAAIRIGPVTLLFRVAPFEGSTRTSPRGQVL